MSVFATRLCSQLAVAAAGLSQTVPRVSIEREVLSGLSAVATLLSSHRPSMLLFLDPRAGFISAPTRAGAA